LFAQSAAPILPNPQARRGSAAARATLEKFEKTICDKTENQLKMEKSEMRHRNNLAIGLRRRFACHGNQICFLRALL